MMAWKFLLPNRSKIDFFRQYKSAKNLALENPEK